MAEQISSAFAITTKAAVKKNKSWSLWPSVLRWIPTSTDHIIAAEKRLLYLVNWGGSSRPNFTCKSTEGLGPWGPDLVRRYTTARFGTGDILTEEESKLLTGASEWKVPTSFIYGFKDWMNYQGAQDARKNMNVQRDIVRVPQGGHFVFLDNPSGFHWAVLYACRRFLSPDPDNYPFPEDMTSA